MEEQASPRHGPWEAVTIAVLVIVVAAAGFALYRSFSQTPGPSLPAATAPPPPPRETQSADLGTEIYEKSSNPISGKLPKTVAPVPNPIQGAYKNPFQ